MHWTRLKIGRPEVLRLQQMSVDNPFSDCQGDLKWQNICHISNVSGYMFPTEFFQDVTIIYTSFPRLQNKDAWFNGRIFAFQAKYPGSTPGAFIEPYHLIWSIPLSALFFQSMRIQTWSNQFFLMDREHYLHWLKAALEQILHRIITVVTYAFQPEVKSMFTNLLCSVLKNFWF